MIETDRTGVYPLKDKNKAVEIFVGIGYELNETF
jgi:hypothetical protein